MPELPEVETIRRQLSPIAPFKINTAKYSAVADSIIKTREFSPEGKSILSIQRKGKLLNFILSDKLHILSHLGMSGGWRVSSQKSPHKHTHLQFEGKDKSGKTLFLYYVDPRRFGKMHFLQSATAHTYLQKLGVDIGSPEFTVDYLLSIFKQHPKKQLKPFLLDQRYFAGCGNYIACEICAHAGIRPSRRCGKITHQECSQIILATQKVLHPMLANQGLSFSGGYSDTQGNKGSGLNHLVVFWQKTCQLCKTTQIKKTILAQRGTFYCPNCQH